MLKCKKSQIKSILNKFFTICCKLCYYFIKSRKKNVPKKTCSYFVLTLSRWQRKGVEGRVGVLPGLPHTPNLLLPGS